MITLNLISIDYKEKLKLKKLYLKIKNFLFIILIFFILASIILLFAKNILQNNFDELVILNSLVKENSQKIGGEIKTLNMKINAANNIQKQFFPWSKIIIDFTKIVPTGLEIHSLKVNKNSWVITGEVKDRETLLGFKKELEKSKYFSEVKSPITNLLQKENIDFELEAIPKFETQ